MDSKNNQPEFEWTQFYQAVADKLREYQNNRTELLNAILKHSNSNFEYLSKDEFPDGTTGPLKDICPFTVFGTFNRAGLKDKTKQKIAINIAEVLDLKLDIPDKFDGIPVVHPMDAWFFLYAKDRESDDIKKLWKLFIDALDYSDNRKAETRGNFLASYNDALLIKKVNRKLSIGLHWIRPWDFIPLDKKTCQYLTHFALYQNKDFSSLDGNGYLNLIEEYTSWFKENSFLDYSFPAFCLASTKKYRSSDKLGQPSSKHRTTESLPFESYTIQDILDDGCFLEKSEVQNLIERLQQKKNLILQGPPGTGKTWIAKRLAYALMENKDDSKVVSVQFHPNLSYEDFVRGWRPSSDGTLELVDGFFMKLINEALQDPNSKFVAIIEEINRGHPSHIFGELLTLLESDKRSPDYSIQLCYPNPSGTSNSTHIPDNVYVVGTMNTADRSLALIDFAFRRRFAFASFEPKLGRWWRKWVIEKCGLDSDLVNDIEQRINILNLEIADDLGKDFQIGHSFVTPASKIEVSTKEWFRQVVETEIGPLLEEYWFDDSKKAKETKDKLLENW